MKKNKLFQIVKVIILLILIPSLFFFWKILGEDSVIGFFKPPVNVNAVKIGAPAPEIVVKSEHHWKRTPFQLSSLKNRPIFFHFWATWCGPCLSELPELLAMADTWKSQGVVLVAVAVDQSWYQVEEFFLSHPDLAPIKERFTLLLDPEAKVADAFKSYRFPETFLINTRFEIDNKFTGAQPWQSPGMIPYIESMKGSHP